MSAFIQFYRDQTGDTETPDEAIAWRVAQDSPEILDTDPELKSLFANVEKELRIAGAPGLMEEAKRGVVRGAKGLASSLVGAAGLGARALGAEGVSDSLIGAAQAIGPQEGDLGTIRSFSEATESPSNFVRYTVGGLGEVFPSVVEAAAVAGAGALTGGTGGFASAMFIEAAKKKLGENAAKTAIASLAKRKAAETGVQVFSLLNSVALNSGEQYNTLIEEGIDPDDAIDRAILGGTIAGVPDALLPSRISNKIINSSNLPKGVRNNRIVKAFQEVTDALGIEAATEGFQEMVSILNVKDAKGESWELNAQDYEQIISAGYLGALGGGIAGAASLAAGRNSEIPKPRMDGTEGEDFVRTPGAEPLPEVSGQEERQRRRQAKSGPLVRSEAGPVQQFQQDPDFIRVGEGTSVVIDPIRERQERQKGKQVSEERKFLPAPTLETELNIVEEPAPSKVQTANPEPAPDPEVAVEQLRIAEIPTEEASIEAKSHQLLSSVDFSEAPITTEEGGIDYQPAYFDVDVPKTYGSLRDSKKKIIGERYKRLGDDLTTGSTNPEEARRVVFMMAPTGEVHGFGIHRITAAGSPKYYLLPFGDDFAKANKLPPKMGGRGYNTRTQLKTLLENYWQVVGSAKLNDANPLFISDSKGPVISFPNRLAFTKAFANPARAEMAAYAGTAEAVQGKMADQFTGQYEGDESVNTRDPDELYGKTGQEDDVADQEEAAPGPVSENEETSIDIANPLSYLTKTQIEELSDVFWSLHDPGKKAPTKYSALDAVTEFYKGTDDIAARDKLASYDPKTQIALLEALGERLINDYKRSKSFEEFLGLVSEGSVLGNERQSSSGVSDAQASVDQRQAGGNAQSSGQSVEGTDGVSGTEASPNPIRLKIQELQTASGSSERGDFNQLAETAILNGINIELLLTDALDGGAYLPQFRKIVLALKDSLSPTHGDFEKLLHEIAHDVFQGLPNADKERLISAISKATDSDLGISEDGPIAIPRGLDITEQHEVLMEERLINSTVKNLIEQGVDGNRSKSILMAMFRKLEEFYVRAMMAIQRALFGKGNESSELARKFFFLKVRQFVSGDGLTLRAINFLGAQTTPGQFAQNSNPAGGFGVLYDFFDPATGEIVQPEPLIRSTGDVNNLARFTVRGFPSQPGASEEVYHPRLAQQNLTNAILRSAYQKYSAAYPTTSKSYEEWLQTVMMIPQSQQPESIIANLVEEARVNGTQITKANILPQDLSNRELEKRAVNDTLAQLAHIEASASKRVSEEAKKLEKSEKGIKETSERLDRVVQGGETLKTLVKDLKDVLRSEIKNLRKDITSTQEASEQAGELKAVLAQLEGIELGNRSLDRRAYEDALNKVVERWIDTEKFGPLLVKASRLKVDWRTVKREELLQKLRDAAANDKSFEVFIPENRLDRPKNAMLGTLLVFAKRRQSVMDTIAVRTSKLDDEIAEFSRAIKDLKTSSMESLDAIREAALKKLPRTFAESMRVMDEVVETRRRLKKLEKDKERARLRIEQLSKFLNSDEFTGAKRGAEGILGVLDEEYEPVPGSTYIVPPDYDASHEAVSKNKKTLLIGMEAFSRSSLLDDIEAMKIWLRELPEGQRKGAVVNRVERQIEKLGAALATLETQAVKPSTTKRLFGSFVQRLEQMKLVESKALATMGRKYDAAEKFVSDFFQPVSVVWTGAMAKVLEAVKKQFPNHDYYWVDDNLYQPLVGFMAQDQESMSKARDEKEFLEMSVTRFLNYAETLPKLGGMVRNSEIRKALIELVRKTGDAAVSMRKIQDEFGNKVKDKSLKGPDRGYGFRNLIGFAIASIPRSVRKEMSVVVRKMQEAGWNNLTWSARGFDVAALQAAFNDPLIWSDFVEPLVRGSNSAFQTTVFSNAKRTISREDLVTAFEKVEAGDFIAFAEALFQDLGGSQLEADPETESPKAKFTRELGLGFAKKFSELFKYFQERDGGTGSSSPGIDLSIGLDARIAESWPVEWTRRMNFDVHSMRQIGHALVFHKVFGRNGETAARLFKTGLNHLQRLQSAYRKAVETVKLRPGKLPKGKDFDRALFPLLGIETGNWNEFRRYAESERMINEWNRIQMGWERWKNLDGGLNLEFKPFAELLSTMVSAAVQSGGSALIDTSSMILQPLFKLGASKTAIRAIVSGEQSFASLWINSALGAFGKQSNLGRKAQERRTRLGFVSPMSATTFRQKMLAERVQPLPRALGPTAKRVVRGARLARQFIGNFGFQNKAQPGKGINLQPTALFSQTSEAMHLASVDMMLNEAENLVEAAVNFYKEHRGHLDNDSYEVTAKDVGYASDGDTFFDNKRGFEYMRNLLLEYGIDLDYHAKSYVRNGSRGELFTKQQYIDLSGAAITEINLASGLSTRPLSTLTDQHLNAFTKLLGWSIAKTVDLFGVAFRNPRGDRDWTWEGIKSFAKIAAVVLPVGMAYAILREEYDEELLGKKRNLKPIKGPADPETYAALLERLAMVGVFGMAGDVANTAVNFMGTNDTRGISMDQRVFFANSMYQALRAMSTAAHQGTATYETVGRPLLQALGGSGYLQGLQIINNMFDLDNAEARVTARINVSNIIRSYGRSLDMPVKINAAGGFLPTKVTPWMKLMLNASMANDSQGFRAAYRSAITAAKKMDKPDPEAYIKQSFQYYSPLKAPFKTMPTPGEQQILLRAMSPEERKTVLEAIRLFEHYNEQL